MREFKRKRGYITIAQRSGKTNYLRMAYGLALSLKATQSKVSHLTVLVTPGTKIPAKYAAVFDEVIEIPWGDDASDFKWKIHNKWKVYHLTPYEETVLLDADMIFPTDVSDWWDTLYQRDVWFATQPVTFRGAPVQISAYRQAFFVNQLPMLYSAFLFFKHSHVAHELFALTEQVYKGWHDLHHNYQLRRTDDDLLIDMDYHQSPLRHGWSHFFHDYPAQVSGDLAFAIATKIIGAEDQFTHPGMFPTFTHMKPSDQGLDSSQASWTNMVSATLRDDLVLTVGNYRQQYPFHYVEKEWLTPDIMTKLENAARG